jgi:hypothetical protein
MARIRFELRPRTRFRLDPRRHGEVLYGAFGTILRQSVCDPACSDARRCRRRDECAYAQLFEPVSPIGNRFGAKDAPKGFLFRTLVTDSDLGPCNPLRFELRLFGKAMASTAFFIDAFERLGTRGLADHAVELVSAMSLDWNGTTAHLLYDQGSHTGAQPIVLDLGTLLRAQPPRSRARIEFITPTLLVDRGKTLQRPELPALVRRLRDRISLLCQFWEATEWQADYRAIGDLPAENVTAVFDGRWDVHGRRSTRTRRAMPVEGYRGTATYEPVHPDLWPLLRIGEEIQVGRHIVWGNGQYQILDG